MLKNRLLASAAAIALALSIAGCTLVTVNPEKDYVADVNGTKINASELDAMVNQYAQIYQMMGMNLSDPAILEGVKNDALDGLIEQEVVMQEANKQGFGTMTTEETAEIDEEYNNMMKDFKEGFRAQAEAEKEADDTIDVEAKTQELYLAALEAQGMTEESAKQMVIDNKAYSKLEKSIFDKVTVTDEDLKSWYDTELAAQKTAVEEDKTSYVGRQSAGDALFVPEGYTYAKHILINSTPSEEDAAKIAELEADQKAKSEEMTALILEDKEKNAAKIDELTAQVNASKDEVTALKAKADGPAKAKADEVYAKATVAGADFDALMAEFGEDPGMKSDPNMTQGYLVGEGVNFEPAFLEGAMALKAEGDISAPIQTPYGYHIIKRVGAPTTGDVPFEQVAEKAKETVTNTKQSEAWRSSVESWKSAAKITKNI